MPEWKAGWWAYYLLLPYSVRKRTAQLLQPVCVWSHLREGTREDVLWEHREQSKVIKEGAGLRYEREAK